ncbi:hypothetical protein LBMAG56_26110 [Verrucomicrobiota bacterium]|nr:hypothetical protein LBMAG56_26110 [Verrucomicrobiota bacterium]
MANKRAAVGIARGVTGGDGWKVAAKPNLRLVMKTRYFFLSVLGMVVLPALAQVSVGAESDNGGKVKAPAAKTGEAIP